MLEVGKTYTPSVVSVLAQFTSNILSNINYIASIIQIQSFFKNT